MFNLRFCLVHRPYADLARLAKRIARLMPSNCLVLLTCLSSLLLLTLVQLVAYQPDLVQLQPALPEPSELIRNATTTNYSGSNNGPGIASPSSSSSNANYVHTNLTLASSFKLPSSVTSLTSKSSLTSPNSFASNSLAASNSISFSISSSSSNSFASLKSPNFSAAAAAPSAAFQPARNDSNGSSTNTTTNHDLVDQKSLAAGLNRSGLSHMIISSNKSSLIKAKKSDPFKIEALLVKSPSAFQTNNRELNSLTNKGRIKQIIKSVLSERRLQKEKLDKNSTLSAATNGNTVSSSNKTFEHCPLLPPNLGTLCFSFSLFLESTFIVLNASFSQLERWGHHHEGVQRKYCSRYSEMQAIRQF